MCDQMDNFNREIVTIGKNKMEVLENEKHGNKSRMTLMASSIDSTQPRKESVKLSIDQKKLPTEKSREHKKWGVVGPTEQNIQKL